MTTKNQKISESLKLYFANNVHQSKGKPGKTPSEEVRKQRGEAIRKAWDVKGRRTDVQKKAANKANVYAYRARLRNAIPENADLKLIKKIYEHCPEGYQVDHRIALAVGGQHHQDNLQYLPRSENCRKGKNRSYDESLVVKWQDVLQNKCDVAQPNNVPLA